MTEMKSMVPYDGRGIDAMKRAVAVSKSGGCGPFMRKRKYEMLAAEDLKELNAGIDRICKDALRKALGIEEGEEVDVGLLGGRLRQVKRCEAYKGCSDTGITTLMLDGKALVEVHDPRARFQPGKEDAMFEARYRVVNPYGYKREIEKQ